MPSHRTMLGALVCGGLLACATAGEGEGAGGYPASGGTIASGGAGATTSGGGSPGGGSGGSSSGSGGSSSGSGGTTTSTTTGGSGGDPGPTCDPPQHWCGDVCSDNTPATGCYQSVSCSPCAAVPNGTATCSAQGQCVPSCNSPYVPSGNVCICPQQCCSNSDCSGGATCQNGTCVDPCDEPLCIAICLLQQKLGLCVNDQCVCI